MTSRTIHRLEGLVPDNLLAFMTLLGLLRCLEEARPDWLPRAFWTIDALPIRPALRLTEPATEGNVIDATSEGLESLTPRHQFGELADLALSPDEAARRLREAVDADPYTADLWSALVSDAAVSRDGKKAEPTPLCLMFGQGHQHFLSRLASIPREKRPPKRGSGRNKKEVSEADCLREALFSTWRRPDTTASYRWDLNEDVRYALRARDPTDAKTKETTQHGANRLASVGLSALTVVPQRQVGGIRLAVAGGERERNGGFTFGWPIWREPMSLAGIRALLGHPHLDRPETRAALGIVERRRTRRISFGKFMNVTRAEVTPESD